MTTFGTLCHVCTTLAEKAHVGEGLQESPDIVLAFKG